MYASIWSEVYYCPLFAPTTKICTVGNHRIS